MEEEIEIGEDFEYKQQLTCFNEKCKEIPIIQVIPGEEEEVKIRMICSNMDCKEKKEITLEEFIEKNEIKYIPLPSCKCKRISKHHDKLENISEIFCPDCKTFLCKECLNMHNNYFEDERKDQKHTNFKTINEKKKEDKKNLIYMEEKNIYYCKYHKKEILKYHCVECNSDYCEKCVEKHKNHKAILLEEMSKKINVEQINKDIKRQKEQINEYINDFQKCEKYVDDRIKKINEEIKKLEEEKQNLPKIKEKIKEMSQVFKTRNENILNFVETLINNYTFSEKQNYNQLFNIINHSKFSLNFEFKDYSPDEMKSLYQKSISFDEKKYTPIPSPPGVSTTPIIPDKSDEIKSVTKGNKILLKCVIKEDQDKQFVDIIGNQSYNNSINENNCEIYINGKLIDFQRTYRFDEQGEFDIELLIKNDLNNLQYLFYNCYCYTKIDLRYFNSKGVTNMNHMFYSCSSLKEVIFGNFDTSNVTSMGGLFRNCQSLSKVDLSYFNTSKVQEMQYMFYNCPLITIDLSNFDFTKTRNISYMFSNCTKLTEIKMSDSFGEKDKTIDYFGYCISSNGVLYCSGKRIIKKILSTGLNNWKIIKSWN